jgi:hypothetical protein
MSEGWKRAKDLKPGDRFDYWGKAVTAVEVHCDIHGVNVRTGYGWIGGWKDPGTPVLLTHRPKPEGMTDADMFGAVIDRAAAVVQSVGPENIGRPRSVERRIAELSEAIEAYELSKPT